MSDNFPAAIYIGGNVTAEKLERLFNAAVAQGVGLEYGVPLSDASLSLNGFIAHLQQGAPLVDDEARYGAFEALEAFCRRNALPYRRHNSAKYEYDAELAWWQPGMSEPATVTSCEDEQALVPVAKVAEALANGTIKKLLKDLTPPELPPFEIVPPAPRRRRKKGKP